MHKISGEVVNCNERERERLPSISTMGLRTGIGREAKHRREMRLENEREWGGKRIVDEDGVEVEEGKRKLGFLRKQEEEDNMVLLNRGATALSITLPLGFDFCH